MRAARSRSAVKAARSRSAVNTALPCYPPTILLFGCDDWRSNTCLEGTSTAPPSSIDYTTLRPEALPNDWGTERGALRDAKSTETLGKLMGRYSIDIPATSESVKELCKAKKEENNTFNEDGEFSSAFGQIPISRLIDMEDQKKIEIVNSNRKETLKSLFTLQNPNSSRWKKPFIRIISNHVYDGHKRILTVKLYIYFTRLIFELIADSTVKHIVEQLEEKPFLVKSLHKRPQQPIMFNSIPVANESERFSLAGLLQHNENN